MSLVKHSRRPCSGIRVYKMSANSSNMSSANFRTNNLAQPTAVTIQLSISHIYQRRTINMKLGTIILSLAAVGLAMPSNSAANADTKHKVGTSCPVSSRKSCSFDRKFVVSVVVISLIRWSGSIPQTLLILYQVECSEGDGTGPPLTWQTVKRCREGTTCHNAKGK